MRKLIIAVSFLIVLNNTQAQPVNIDTVKSELFKINKVFDSSMYLGFKVDAVYSSDTLFGEFEHEEMTGDYILNQKDFYYKIGNTEYVQNDSFIYNIYHDDKMMIMTYDTTAFHNSLFPLKEFLDSVINQYDSLYTISMNTDTTGIKVIEFTSLDTNAAYDRFAVYYEPLSYKPQRFELSFKGNFDLSDVPDSLRVPLMAQPLHKRLSMSFYDYYNLTSLDVFENVNYVFYDRMRKAYRPSEKYKAFRFMANGVEGEEDDDSIEAKPDTEESNP